MTQGIIASPRTRPGRCPATRSSLGIKIILIIQMWLLYLLFLLLKDAGAEVEVIALMAVLLTP